MFSQVRDHHGQGAAGRRDAPVPQEGFGNAKDPGAGADGCGPVSRFPAVLLSIHR